MLLKLAASWGKLFLMSSAEKTGSSADQSDCTLFHFLMVLSRLVNMSLSTLIWSIKGAMNFFDCKPPTSFWSLVRLSVISAVLPKIQMALSLYWRKLKI